MKRSALTIAAPIWRWLNGKPDPRAAHRMIVAVVAAVALLAILSPTPAAADHGHNCIWSGGAWVGQGLCPGMPGYTPHADPPSPTPEPTAAPTTTTQPASAPSATTAAPTPSSTPTVTRTTPAPEPARTTTAPAPTPTPTPTRTPGCLMSYGNVWCSGGAAVPSLYPLRVLR